MADSADRAAADRAAADRAAADRGSAGQGHAELVDVLKALLARASPELFGTVRPTIALTVSGESLTFDVLSGQATPDRGPDPPAPDPPAPDPPAPDPPAPSDRVVRSLRGSGQATVSLSGVAARVRRARDLTLAVLATDIDRVVGGVRSSQHEGPYWTTRRLTGVTVTGVETLPAGDVATARIILRIEAVLEFEKRVG